MFTPYNRISKSELVMLAEQLASHCECIKRDIKDIIIDKLEGLKMSIQYDKSTVYELEELYSAVEFDTIFTEQISLINSLIQKLAVKEECD